MLNQDIYLEPPLERKLENQGVANVNDVNVGEEVRRVAERKCDTVTRLKPAEWRVSIPLLSFACGSPSFQTVL